MDLQREIKLQTKNICHSMEGHNQFHNILRLLDVLPNFLFTTSETMGHYYLETQYVRVASQVAERLKTEDLRKLGNIRKLSKLHGMIA